MHCSKVIVSAAGADCAGPVGDEQDIQKKKRIKLIITSITSSVELGKGLLKIEIE
jgi:hypothetical protein